MVTVSKIAVSRPDDRIGSRFLHIDKPKAEFLLQHGGSKMGERMAALLLVARNATDTRDCRKAIEQLEAMRDFDSLESIASWARNPLASLFALTVLERNGELTRVEHAIFTAQHTDIIRFAAIIVINNGKIEDLIERGSTSPHNRNVLRGVAGLLAQSVEEALGMENNEKELVQIARSKLASLRSSRNAGQVAGEIARVQEAIDKNDFASLVAIAKGVRDEFLQHAGKE